MEINEALINKLAMLSRLEFTGQQQEDIAQDLQRMISFVHKLNELDTIGIEPLMHIHPVVNVYRADIPGEPFPRHEALRNAKEHGQEFFTVPKVIRK